MTDAVSTIPLLRESSPHMAAVAEAYTPSDRRLDVDAKHARIGALLEEIGCESLLILDPANFAWLTSGGVTRSVLDPEQTPGLYFTLTNRWLLSSNVESQRMFDEEIGELGFMLKEWPWHWRREQLLTDLCQGKKLAADTPFLEAQLIDDRLAESRRVLSAYEQACYVQLGKTLAHSLEATCRGCKQGDTERELAGQISHRLIHRGTTATAISVAADGRSKMYRRHGYTSAAINKHCVVAATAKKYGLYAYAARAFSFGPPEESFQKEHLATCKVAAHFVASSWPDAVVAELFNKARRVYHVSGFEHEWTLCPQGALMGRVPVETTFTPDTVGLLRSGWAVAWHPSVGAASNGDTFLVTADGPEWITPTESWPMVRAQVSGAEFARPYILER